MVYNLFTIAKTMESSPVVCTCRVRTGRGAPERASNELIKHYPTMESLFGSMDFCECEHCRSVLSPAAYLVDLLQFVEGEDAVWARFLTSGKDTGIRAYPYRTERKFIAPYDALIERRPDLPHIPLTCENTQHRAALHRPRQRNPGILRG